MDLNPYQRVLLDKLGILSKTDLASRTYEAESLEREPFVMTVVGALADCRHADEAARAASAEADRLFAEAGERRAAGRLDWTDCSIAMGACRTAAVALCDRDGEERRRAARPA